MLLLVQDFVQSLWGTSEWSCYLFSSASHLHTRPGPGTFLTRIASEGLSHSSCFRAEL